MEGGAEEGGAVVGGAVAGGAVAGGPGSEISWDKIAGARLSAMSSLDTVDLPQLWEVVRTSCDT